MMIACLNEEALDRSVPSSAAGYADKSTSSLSCSFIYVMAAAFKKRGIAAAWTVAGAVGCGTVYVQHRKFEERFPCVQLAIKQLEDTAQTGKLGLGSQIRLSFWPRRGHVDKNAGLMRARFRVHSTDGRVADVLVAAREKRNQVSEVWESKEDDDEEQQWNYWFRPWELKKAIVQRVRLLRQGFTASEVQSDSSTWSLETLVVLASDTSGRPLVLQGDPSGLPEYETMCVRGDAAAKSDRSRTNLKIALCLSVVGTLFAAGSRMLKSIRVSQSYGFVRRSVLEDRSVQAVLGSSQIESCTGTFTPTFIDARLRLVGSSGTIADVVVAASRDSSHQKWHVAVARMSIGGVACNLELPAR